MIDGLLLLRRVIETRRIDAEAELHLVGALMRWHSDSAADGTMLLRYLGLPTTAIKFRQATRDYWLCVASDLIGGDTAAERARRLYPACSRFEVQVWPRWKNFSNAPDGADEISGYLHKARQSGEFPAQRQLRNILSEAFTDSNFPRPDANLSLQNIEGVQDGNW